MSWLPQSLPEWLGAYGALVSTMLGIHAIRKDRSRVSVRVRVITPEAGDPDVAVTVSYLGGPALPLKAVAFRMLGMIGRDGKRYKYNVFTLPRHDDNVLRAEHRDVELRVYSKRDVIIDRLWYVVVEAGGGAKFRRFYRIVPPMLRARRAQHLKSDEPSAAP